jgi:hypothetical protein
MIAQLRWVASSRVIAPIELVSVLNRLVQHIRHASCCVQTQHAAAILQIGRSGRVYLACPDCGHQSRGWQTPWRGSRPV